jgi:hypothetical protein
VDGDARDGGLPSACPSCGAAVRGDVSWCTQCYAPLREEQKPTREPTGDVGPTDLGPTVVDPGPTAAGAGSRPEAVRETPPATSTSGRTADPAEVERLAEQMLAKLATERDDVHGLASRVPRTAGARALLVTLVIVVGSALVLLLMFVLGSVF